MFDLAAVSRSFIFKHRLDGIRCIKTAAHRLNVITFSIHHPRECSSCGCFCFIFLRMRRFTSDNSEQDEQTHQTETKLRSYEHLELKSVEQNNDASEDMKKNAVPGVTTRGWSPVRSSHWSSFGTHHHHLMSNSDPDKVNTRTFLNERAMTEPEKAQPYSFLLLLPSVSSDIQFLQIKDEESAVVIRVL